jgi:hypothetical protein
MAIKEGEIIPYQEQRLLVLPGAELDAIQPGEIVKSTEPYLGTDVYIGSYGVASFGLFVPKPQIRPTVYYPGEGPVSNSPNSDETTEDDGGQYANNPLRRFHYHGTEKGFAVIRTILAPIAVSQKLEEDQHLGPALINKSCLEGTVPDELDEMTELEEPESRWSSSGVVLDKTLLTVEMRYEDEPNPYTIKVLNQLQAATGTSYNLLREYPSWHSYRAYRPVMEAMIQGCQATVANFDEVLALLAKDMTRLHDFSAAQLGRTSLAALNQAGKDEEK